MSADRYIALLPTARDVIKADAACHAEGVRVRVIATPESISAECGMCLAIEPTDIEQFTELIKLKDIKVDIYDTRTL